LTAFSMDRTQKMAAPRAAADEHSHNCTLALRSSLGALFPAD
jgi:hypothetical protein